MEARIVLIVNHEHTRDLFSLALRRKGWQVFSYPYDQINLTVLEQRHPDLVILDFNALDEYVGWEFLQYLKMREITAKIPILITTDFQLSAEVQSYLLLRYICVSHQPFDLDSFVALVHKILTQANQAGVICSDNRTLPILVVDDEEDIRETTTAILQMQGYSVAIAENGLVALNMVSRADYCLILLDIAMPVLNGYEFLKAYEQQLRPHCPIIIISADVQILTRVLPSFVVEALPKPFPINQLLGLVGKYADPV
jgi:DNA-binding response OmpR family regulator